MMDDEHLVHFHAIKTRKDSKETREKSWKGRCGEDSTLVRKKGRVAGLTLSGQIICMGATLAVVRNCAGGTVALW